MNPSIMHIYISKSITYFAFFLIFCFIERQLTYNIILVLDVRHNDLIYVPIAK